MAKYTVELEGTIEEVATLKEVANVLGVSTVSGKDIENGKYPEVSLIEDMTVEEVGSLLQTTTDEINNDEVYEEDTFLDDHVEIIMVGDTPTKGDVKAEDIRNSLVEALTNKEDTPKEVVTVDLGSIEVSDVEEVEYPEVGDFTEVKALKKYIKALSNEHLTEWVELEGVEYKPNNHESINRMRQAMAINALHFPELVKQPKAKKKSKYSDYTMEDLVQMALDNDVEVRDAKGDDRIERMYTIMALKEAGLLA